MPFKDIPTALGDVSANSITFGGFASNKKLYQSASNYVTLLNGDGSSSDLSIDAGGTLTSRGSATIYGGAGNAVTVAGAANGGNVLLGVATGSTGPNLGAVVGNVIGTGALMAQVPDSGTAGGNARGSNAVDWQTSRTAATQVASATGASIAGGQNNTASGNYSLAAGSANSATSTYAVALGRSNTANAIASIATGQQSSAHAIMGARVHSGAMVAAIGDAQLGEYVLSGRSTAGAAVRLTADGAAAGAANIANIPLNTAWSGVLHVTARDTSTGNCARWAIPFGLGVQGTAGSTAYVEGTVDFANIIGAVGLITQLARSADTTNRGVNLTFTPPNSNTWDVCAVMRTAEVQ